MTKYLYHQDAYLKQFEAEITAIEPELHAVALNQTAFYPGGGGQPHDSGWLSHGNNKTAINKVQKLYDEIWHIIDVNAELPETGTMIHGEIDWQRRYQLMRTHSAMHVLCGVVFRDYGALVTGGNMEPLEGRMDFEFETMSKELVEVIENSVNNEIKESRPIIAKILPREEAFTIPDLIRTKINLLPPQISEIRTIEIVGLDLQADGGTHVNNTNEIGKVHISDYKSKGKINKRIYLSLEASSQ
jgi:misacylated tRNA(Ala) deacylase